MRVVRGWRMIVVAWAASGLFSVGQQAAQAFVMAGQPALYTGPSTLGTPVATTTTGPLTPLPTIIFPELDAQRTTDLPNGFSVLGRFDFLNGAGTAAELKFTAMRPVTLRGAQETTSTTIDGLFGILSEDFVPVGGSLTIPVAAHLDSFSATTSLVDLSSNPLAGSLSTATDTNQTIPTTLTFPTGAYHSLVGPVTSGSFMSTGNYMLVQNVDIKISGLLPGETVDIGLPITSTLDPSTAVPEPASMLLFGIGALGMMVHLHRRRRPLAA